ncbi:MAG: tail fiber domain-containing protein [Burkholderiales bacterium]|nr:tail fiber domain-containing protein [Burkholderiales bacterium]
MPDQLEPYVPANAGDIIRAADWNQAQIKAREALATHDHAHGNGQPISREGIAQKAIDGSRIDPNAEVKLKSLELSGPLKVNARDILAEVDKLLALVPGSDQRDFATRNLVVDGTAQLRGSKGGIGLTVIAGGNVGIGTANPTESLDVDGRTKSGLLTVGAWPPNQKYVFFGANTLKQSAVGNYALLQQASEADAGRTFLNSPVDIRFRINNADRMVLASDGNIGIGTATPTHKFHVVANDAVGLFESSGGQAYLRLATKEGIDNRVEIANRPGGRLSLWTAGGHDVLNITKEGNVGIGTTDPGNSKLKIADSGTDYVDIRFASSGMGQLELVGWSRGWNINTKTDGKHLYINRDAGSKSDVLIGRNGNELVVSGSDGSVQMKGTCSAARFVGALTSANGKYILTMQDDRNLVCYTVGGGPFWNTRTNVSDINLKKDLRPINNALDKLRSLRGIFFSWKDETLGKEEQLGVVAQEVEKVFPGLVSTISGRKLVDYQGLIPVLIEAMKEQQELISRLQQEVRGSTASN